MLFLTIPTANSHPELLRGIVETCGLPRDHIILVATRPNLELPEECVVVEDLDPPNIQRWWNLGIETAIDRGATAVAVLNDDLVINEETLDRLHSELIRTGAAIATPTRPDWGAGLFKNENLFPYTPVIWGCLWMVNVSSSLRPDPRYVWWYGDSDLDIRARTQGEGIVAVDAYYEHFYPGEGTSNSGALMAQTAVDAATFELNHRDFLNQSRSASPRKLFVQGQHFAGRRNEEPNYRTDFFRYVCKAGDPSKDRVVLVEPNDERQDSLRQLWVDWRNVLIVKAIVSVASHEVSDLKGATAYRIPSSEGRSSRVSNWKLDVHRFDPSAIIEEYSLPKSNLQDLISEVLPGTKLDTLVIDLRVNRLEEASTLDPQPKEIIAIGEASNWKNTRIQARKMGLYFTGRPWGEARSCAGFSRARSHVVRRWRSQAGEMVDSIANWRRQRARENIFKRQASAAPSESSINFDLVDSTKGSSVPTFDLQGAEELLHKVAGPSNKPSTTEREWYVEIDSDSIIQQRIDQCFTKYGVWPISLSIPSTVDLNPAPEEIISPIFPGYPYSFHDEASYLKRYSNSFLALTHRKAGWDCFRHVEILGSGSTPLMLDVSEIPAYSMVHYPKDALKRIVDEVTSRGGVPSWQFRIDLRRFVQRHLTTQSMANYLLSTTGAREDSTVLFIDESLSATADYVSALTAIGLKEVLGRKCQLSPEIDYLYADTQLDTNCLYGRGFGYTRKLSPATRSSRHEIGMDYTKLQRFEYIVIGNVSRNWEIARQVLRHHDSSKVILIHGEDLPPSPDQNRVLVNSGAHVFVRSIH